MPGPPRSYMEARCAEIVSSLVPFTSTNRFCCGFELDIVVESEDCIVNLEVDGPHHQGLKQRRIDARRDAFLARLGVRVARVAPIDEDGKELVDLREAVFAALRDAGLPITAFDAP